jgi:hypothetical protein
MTEETTSKRDGKGVLSKIQHIERTWRSAHNFANSETKASIKESDGEAQFEELVKRKYPYYYNLIDIMADRASSQPKCTSYDADNDEEDNLSLSDISDNDERGNSSVATRRTTGTGTSNSKKNSGGKNKRKAVSLMDDSVVAALKAGNVAMEN